MRAVTRPGLRPLWLATLVFSVVITSYFTFLPTFVDEVGFGSVGLFFFAYSVTAILLRAFLAWLPERVGPKRVLFPAFAVFTTGLLVLAAAGDGTAVAVAGILTGLGHGYIFPILLSLTVSRTSSGDRGSAMALFTAIFDAGILVGGPLLGAIITLAGYPSMYAASAVIVVVGAAAYGIWDRRNDPMAAQSPA